MRHPSRGDWIIVDRRTNRQRPVMPTGAKLPLLVVHLDQCSIGRSAMFFASQRRSLLLAPQWDIFHRCWNDVLGSAANVSGLRRAILFLTTICNIPYGPWSESTFFQSRRDFFKKFISSSTVDAEWFQASADEIARDRGRRPPRDRDSLCEVFQLCAETEFVQRKGPQVKMMRWFTLFSSLQDLLPNWALLREAYTHYHMLFHSRDDGASIDALRPDGDTAAANDYRRELKELRSKSGNTLSLGARLMTAELKRDALIMTAVVRSYWVEFNGAAEVKTSPKANRAYFSQEANGGWIAPVRNSLKDAIACPASLRKMGIVLGHVAGGEMDAETVDWQRKVSSIAAQFARELAGARAISSGEYHMSYPGRFAFIIDDTTTNQDKVEAVKAFRSDFERLLQLERMRLTRDDIDEVLAEVEWVRMPINRVLMHMFDRPPMRDVIDAEAAALVREMFSSFGDTLIIENTHNVLRRMTVGTNNDTSSECSRQYTCVVGTLLEDRGITAVNVENSTGEKVNIGKQWHAPPEDPVRGVVGDHGPSHGVDFKDAREERDRHSRLDVASVCPPRGASGCRGCQGVFAVDLVPSRGHRETRGAERRVHGAQVFDIRRVDVAHAAGPWRTRDVRAGVGR